MAFVQTLQDHLLVPVKLDTNLMLMVLHVQVIHEHKSFPKSNDERIKCQVFSTFTDERNKMFDINFHGS
jgi:hypothetical protein